MSGFPTHCIVYRLNDCKYICYDGGSFHDLETARIMSETLFNNCPNIEKVEVRSWGKLHRILEKNPDFKVGDEVHFIKYTRTIDEHERFSYDIIELDTNTATLMPANFEGTMIFNIPTNELERRIKLL